MNNRFYGLYSNFNPKLILIQMASMQLLFYSSLSLFLILFDIAFGLPFHLGQFFDSTTFNTNHTYGTLSILAFILNIPIMIAGMVYIIVKANKVLDFIITVYFIHMLLCLLYNRFKFFSLGWFMVIGICVFVTVILGEYICIKIEQQEIMLFENLISNSVSKGKKKKSQSKQQKCNNDIEMGQIQQKQLLSLPQLQDTTNNVQKSIQQNQKATLEDEAINNNKMELNEIKLQQ